MDKLYHFTSFNKIASICVDGLLPTIGFRSMTIADSKCSVFLSMGMEQAIKMYASMLWRYDNNSGKKGEKKIKSCTSSLNNILHALELGGYDEFLESQKGVLESELIRLNLIGRCRNFNEYLGGDGCYLSVYGMEDDLKHDSENYWCDIPIPTNNINVVYLQNKITGERYFSRDDILSYFMSFFSPMQLAKGDNETFKQVNHLYEYKNIYLHFDYLRNVYDLCEMPFNEYVNDKVKTLIFD